jgi:uncharacterized membrane protein YqjE
VSPADRSISAVLHDIVGNIQDIVRCEIRLAKTELTEEMGKSRSAGMLVGIGALMFAFSALFLLLAALYALSLLMPEWAAALIVGVGVGATAALCLGAGIRRFRAVRAGPKTVASMKENVEWAKQLTK